MWRQMPEVLAVLGRRFGEYPFFADKFWVAQAPYLGMEHQTIVAYGAGFSDNEFGFDELLLHEVAHEWWGNKITAPDWGDFWIHEGFASYAEALYVLDTQGEERYLEYMQVLRSPDDEPGPGGQRGGPHRHRGLLTRHLRQGRVGAPHAAVSPRLTSAMTEILWRFADGDRPGGLSVRHHPRSSSIWWRRSADLGPRLVLAPLSLHRRAAVVEA